MKPTLRVTGCLSLLLLTGCLATLVPPDFENFFDSEAAKRYPDRNPVIVIPGFLGTRLVDADSGTVIWGAVGGNFADPDTPEGSRLLALSLRDDVSSPNVQPGGVLDRFRFRVLSVRLKSYHEILHALGEAGYRDEDLSRRVDFGDERLNSFQFAYDWRLSNADNARRLHEFILEKAAYCRTDRQRRGLRVGEIRFDLIAHSMGGLLARYYLRYGPQPLPADGSLPELTWEGAHHVERAILVATPNAGAAQAALSMTRGVRHSPGLPHYDAMLNGTYPAPYQLLPRSRHGATVDARDPTRRLDLLDPDLWEQAGWGLANRDQEERLQWLLPDIGDANERRRLALAYQRKMLRHAGQFQRAMDVPASPPEGTELFLIAGTAEPTPSVLAIDPETGEVEVVGYSPGDGRVPRFNALMRGPSETQMEMEPGVESLEARPRDSEPEPPIAWRDTVFTARKHSRMSGGRVFADRVAYWLLELPREELSRGDDRRQAPADPEGTGVYDSPSGR